MQVRADGAFGHGEGARDLEGVLAVAVEAQQDVALDGPEA